VSSIAGLGLGCPVPQRVVPRPASSPGWVLVARFLSGSFHAPHRRRATLGGVRILVTAVADAFRTGLDLLIILTPKVRPA
jgi:hypothetical protein